MVCNYGNLVSSGSGLLLGIAMMVMEDQMLAMGMGIALKMGMVVFALSSLLRMIAYDTLYSFQDDSNNSPADINTANEIMKDIKLEMALTTAHEAMSKLTLMKAMDGMDMGKGGKKGRKGDKDDSESDMEGMTSDEEGMSSGDEKEEGEDWNSMDDGAELIRF